MQHTRQNLVSLLQHPNPRNRQTHERLTKSAFDFTSAFADRCAQARRRGEPMPSSGGAPKGAEASSSSSQSIGGSGGGRGRGRGRGNASARVQDRDGGRTNKAPPPPPPLSSSPDVRALIGTTVGRLFDDEWFDGLVSYDDPPFYTVTFSDGDKEDYTALELRALADGVFPGAKICYHSGDLDGGWDSGTVIEPYEKKHGKLWAPKGYEGQASAAHSWLVHFQSGVAPVALPNERKVEARSNNPPGSWMSIDESESQKRTRPKM